MPLDPTLCVLELLDCEGTQFDSNIDCVSPESIAIHFDPTDSVPPDPSVHSFNSKRDTPGIRENPEQQRKKTRKEVTTLTPTTQTGDPNSELPSSCYRDYIADFLLGNLFRYL